MKTLYIALLFLSTVAKGTPLLTYIEQDDLLRSIDSICGDTWCEGDSDWSFDALSCDSDTGCLLNLTMKPYDFNEDQHLSARPFVCELNGFRERSRIFEINSHGVQYTPALYRAISQCISDIGAKAAPIYVPIDNRCASLFNESAALTPFRVKGILTTGVNAAINAVSILVSQRAQDDNTCELIREPYYKDHAVCTDKTDGSEECLLPSLDGAFKVTRSVTNEATVVYLPGVMDLGESSREPSVFKQID